MARQSVHQQFEKVYTPAFTGLLERAGFDVQRRESDEHGVDLRAEAMRPADDGSGSRDDTGAMLSVQLKASRPRTGGGVTIHIVADRVMVLFRQAGISCLVGCERDTGRFFARRVESLVRELDNETPEWHTKPTKRLSIQLLEPVTEDWLRALHADTIREHDGILAMKTARFGSPSALGRAASKIHDLVVSPAVGGLDAGLTKKHAEAVTAIHAGLLDEAAVILAEIIRLAEAKGDHAKLTAAYSNYGAVLDDLGRPEEAIAALRKAIVRPDAGVNPHLNLAIVLSGQGQAAEAQESLDRARGISPADPGVLSAVGMSHLAEGRYKEATECFDALLDARPDLPQPYYSLSLIQEREGRVTEAILTVKRGLRRVRQSHPKKWTLWLRLGDIHLIPDLKAINAITVATGGRNANLTFGVAALKAHRPIGAAEARKAFAKASPLMPEDRSEVIARRAMAGSMLGRFREVRALGAELAGLPGKAAEGAYIQAVAWMMEGRMDQAVEVLLPAIEAAPGDHTLLHQLGICYFDMGNAELAIKYCKASAVHVNASERDLVNIIAVCQKWPRMVATAAVLREVLAVHPDAKRVHWALLGAMDSVADSREMESETRDFIRKWPDDWPARRALATTLVNGAKNEAAFVEYEQIPSGELAAGDLLMWAAALTRERAWEDAERRFKQALPLVKSESDRAWSKRIRDAIESRIPVSLPGRVILLP